MKPLPHKKPFLFTTLACLFFSTVIAPATAAIDDGTSQALTPQTIKALSHRRTLHIGFGEKRIIIEAPRGMCFLDESDPSERMAVAVIKQAARETQGRLMAVFTDCLQISGMTGGTLDFNLVDKGTITWMTSHVPPSYAASDNLMDKQDYIEMRAAGMGDYVTRGLRNFPSAMVDTQERVHTHGVSVSYDVPLDIDSRKLTASGITAATMVRGLPIDISFTRILKRGESDPDSLHDMMDKMTAQLAALNP